MSFDSICMKIIKNYLSWYSDQLHCYSENEDDDCTIITPCLSPDGDCNEIRVYTKNGHIFLSDEGDAYNYLYTHGLDLSLNNPSRKEQVNYIVGTYGVSFDENKAELIKSVGDIKEVGPAMQDLLHCINAVKFLVYKTKEIEARNFKLKVSNTFQYNNIHFAYEQTVKGKTRNHTIDFIVRKNAEQFYLKALSAKTAYYASKLAMETAFTFTDIKRIDIPFHGVAILDDEIEEDKIIWTPNNKGILQEYCDMVVLWSENDPLLKKIA